jgi:hypothetical protein
MADIETTVFLALQNINVIRHGLIYKSPPQWAGSWNLAGATGLEPATSDVTGRRSNQLNYAPAVYLNH